MIESGDESDEYEFDDKTLCLLGENRNEKISFIIRKNYVTVKKLIYRGS